MPKLVHSEVINLLITFALLLLSGRILGEMFRKLKQPIVIGEILAGIILGPTILGSLSPDTFDFFFPKNNVAIAIDGFTKVAVILLLFVAGLEVELDMVIKQSRKALYISLSSILIPFVIGFICAWYFPGFFGLVDENSQLVFSLFLGIALSISALPVIAKILMDTNLLRTQVGMLIISAAMVDDVIGWLVFSVVLSMINEGHGSFEVSHTLALTIGYVLLMLTVGKFVLNKILPWINKSLSFPGGILSLSISFCLLAAAFTEYIGIHAIFGAFIFGVALGDSKHFTERAKEIVYHFVNNIFAPLFFVTIGLKVNFVQNFDLTLTLFVVLISFIGKIVGGGLGAKFGGMSWSESAAIGFGLNARGAMEIILGILALEAGIIGNEMFVALVIMALFTSMTAGPLLKYFMLRNKIDLRRSLMKE